MSTTQNNNSQEFILVGTLDNQDQIIYLGRFLSHDEALKGALTYLEHEYNSVRDVSFNDITEAYETAVREISEDDICFLDFMGNEDYIEILQVPSAYGLVELGVKEM